jgi:hypothetical protein
MPAIMASVSSLATVYRIINPDYVIRKSAARSRHPEIVHVRYN